MPSVLAWTAEEDAMLRSLIQEHGTKKWSLIASLIKSKSSKQCRRRWKNSVDMEAKATTWTPSEDAQLVKFHRELGNKWTQISKRIGDRTDNAVKNRWHALCKKQPELAEEESPVTTVGVRRGTRMRQFSDQDDEEYDDDDDDDYSDDLSEDTGKQRPRKRPRRTAGPVAGVSGGTSRGTASLTERSSGRQPSRLAPYSTKGGSASGLTGGGQSGSGGITLLPTPFDRIASRKGGTVGGGPGETHPVSIVVPPGALTQRELLIAQQLNEKGTPFQIEVAELPRDGTMALNALLSSGVDWIPDSLRLSDGSGSGGQIGIQGGGSGSGGAGGSSGRGARGRGAGMQGGAVPTGTNLLNAHLSGAVGGFGGTLAAPINTMSNAATTNINSSLSINEILNWLNSATAELPPPGVAGDVPGVSVAGGSNANYTSNTKNNNLNRRDSNKSGKLGDHHSSKMDNSGSLHPSLTSGSSGLSSGQRDLLTRLFSQVRDSAELRQQQWHQQLGAAASNGNDALMMFLDRQQSGGASADLGGGGFGGTATDLQRMLSLGLGNQGSLSLGFGAAAAAAAGMGSLPLALSGSLHSNPSGNTRSSSGRVTSAFTEATDAAIAAVEQENRNKEAALAAAAMAEAMVRQHSSGRSLRRGGSINVVGGDGGGGRGRGRAGLSDVPVIAPQYSAQDIDALIGALAVPKAR